MPGLASGKKEQKIKTRSLGAGGVSYSATAKYLFKTNFISSSLNGLEI